MTAAPLSAQSLPRARPRCLGSAQAPWHGILGLPPIWPLHTSSQPHPCCSLELSHTPALVLGSQGALRLPASSPLPTLSALSNTHPVPMGLMMCVPHHLAGSSRFLHQSPREVKALLRLLPVLLWRTPTPACLLPGAASSRWGGETPRPVHRAPLSPQ